MCEYINEGYVSTNTGKYGHHGFITDILKVDEYDTVSVSYTHLDVYKRQR